MQEPINTDRRYTVAEYLAIDEDSDVRYEYRDGELLAMAGAEFEHVQVSINLAGELRNRLAGTPCQPLNSDMRVRAARNRRYCYPDVAVVCGTPLFDPPNRRVTVVNPTVVFEVLSRSTELSDRGEKFTRYRLMESLQQYFLVWPDRPLVEPFYRQADGGWGIGHHVEGLGGALPIRSLNVELPLAEIYARVTFPPLPPAPDQPD